VATGAEGAQRQGQGSGGVPDRLVQEEPRGPAQFQLARKAIGMDTQNFRKNVRRHPGFKEAPANHDIAEAQELGDSRRGFLRPRFVEALSVE